MLVRSVRLRREPPRRQAELRQGHDFARDFDPQGDEVSRNHEEKSEEWLMFILHVQNWIFSEITRLSKE